MEGDENPKDARMSRAKRLSIIIPLMWVNFWMAAIASIQDPFFPKEAEMKGATPTQYGFVFGVYELVIIVMAPVFAKLIVKISPKSLFIMGLVLCGMSCCVFGVLDYLPDGEIYISACFIVRILEGVGAASVMTCTFVIVASAFSDSVATMFSLVETGFGFGLIVGPCIGGILFQLGGFLLPFVVAGAFLLLGFPFIFYYMPHVGETESTSRSRDVLKFLLDPSVLAFAFSITTSMLFIGFNAATLEPHLRKFSLSPGILGLIFVINGAMYALTTPLWGKACDCGLEPKFINLGGYVMTTVGILMIGPAPFIPFQASLGTVIGSQVVIGLGLSAKMVSSTVGCLQNTSKRGFPENLGTYSMVSALVSTTSSVGAFVGPSIGGLLLDTTGYAMGTVVVFGIEAFFFVISAIEVAVEKLKKKSVGIISDNETHGKKSHTKEQPLNNNFFSRHNNYTNF